METLPCEIEDMLKSNVDAEGVRHFRTVQASIARFVSVWAPTMIGTNFRVKSATFGRSLFLFIFLLRKQAAASLNLH
jgi:hypothetical protein